MSADVLERVAERVYRIRERFVNLYVIDVGRIVLVDTGTKGAEPLVREALKELGKELADIRLVLLTHHHLDHVGTAGVWKREAKSTVLVHDDDADVVAGRERRKGKGIGLRAKTLIAFAGVFAWSMRVPPLEPDRRLGTPVSPHAGRRGTLCARPPSGLSWHDPRDRQRPDIGQEEITD